MLSRYFGVLVIRLHAHFRRWLLFTKLNRKYPPTPFNAVSPVMLITSHHLSSPDKERITRLFFEEFGAPAFAIYDAGLLALYAAGVLTGITVDIGYEKTGSALHFQD